jgi:hypothetical protein
MTATIPARATSLAETLLIESTWKRLRIEDYWMSFEYPSVYDAELSDNCTVSINMLTKEDGIQIFVGLAVSITVVSTDAETPNAYVDSMVSASGSNLIIKSQQGSQVSGYEAVEIEYKIGGLPNQIATYVLRNGYVYGVGYYPNESCALSDYGISMLDIYKRVLSSFEFDE